MHGVEAIRELEEMDVDTTSEDQSQEDTGDKETKFRALIRKMNCGAATDVGSIHRVLCQVPKNPKNESKVRTQLSEQLGKKASLALQYVCLDLDLVPEGKFDKKKLVNRLVKWVRAGILST